MLRDGRHSWPRSRHVDGDGKAIALGANAALMQLYSSRGMQCQCPCGLCGQSSPLRFCQTACSVLLREWLGGSEAAGYSCDRGSERWSLGLHFRSHFSDCVGTNLDSAAAAAAALPFLFPFCLGVVCCRYRSRARQTPTSVLLLATES